MANPSCVYVVMDNSEGDDVCTPYIECAYVSRADAALDAIEKYITESLQAEDAAPYYNAAERYDLDYLNDLLELYKACGGHIVVLTWLAKGELSEGFKRASSAAKVLWLRENLPAIEDVRTLEYGTPKWICVQSVKNAILFDDELSNRIQWQRHGGKAYTPSRILRMIERLLR